MDQTNCSVRIITTYSDVEKEWGVYWIEAGEDDLMLNIFSLQPISSWVNATKARQL